jgi:predicted GIY-YIG superfamily endonuclease
MYCIYYFLDENKNPFYVGITNSIKRRTKRHLTEIKAGNRLYKYNKLRKVMKLGINIIDIIVIQEYINTNSRNKAEEREVEIIAQLKSSGFKLCNLTGGGRGASKFLPQIHKAAAKKRTGQKRSIEARLRMSEARIGIKFSDEHKANLSMALKKRIISKKTRLKASKTSKGKINIKKYRLIDINGKEHITTNGLTVFCEKHNLTSTNLHKVLNGERNNHKGWKIERLKNDN